MIDSVELALSFITGLVELVQTNEWLMFVVSVGIVFAIFGLIIGLLSPVLHKRR